MKHWRIHDIFVSLSHKVQTVKNRDRHAESLPNLASWLWRNLSETFSYCDLSPSLSKIPAGWSLCPQIWPWQTGKLSIVQMSVNEQEENKIAQRDGKHMRTRRSPSFNGLEKTGELWQVWETRQSSVEKAWWGGCALGERCRRQKQPPLFLNILLP